MSDSPSPVLRYDVATHDWVLFAAARSKRPHVHEAAPTAQPSASTSACPFCPGSETATPIEIMRLGDGSKDGWYVRVIPNKFPALDHSAAPVRRELGPVFSEMGGYGAHEVVIESPDHSRFLSAQPIEQIDRLIRVLHARFVVLARDPRLQSIVIFKNHGEAAGTSLPHPHWQIIATPIVPHLLRAKHAIAIDHYDRTAQCLYCEMRDEEMRDGSRILTKNDSFVALLPFASHLPYQVRILPLKHRSSFGEVAEDEFRPLASILRDVLARLDGALGNPAFNLTIDTAPIGDEHEPYFLWHIDILPRLSTPAGFEMGSGMSINSVLPETAAAELRAAATG